MKKEQLLLKLLFLMCSILGSLYINAQTTRVVTGIVLDPDAEPLPGVAVVEAQHQTGTFTNHKGEFSIKVSNPNAILSFSFIGMEPQEVKLNGRTKIEVTLETNSKELDDVVVIGYGTAKKSDLTGSTASLPKAALEDKMLTNVGDALRGQIAGVRVLSSNGEPGETLNIRIRGSGSLNASNSPIYVIDGIVSETADLSPGDIESMEVLKDASATAIYGSRGSNGVVMITTKKGEVGQTKVSVDVTHSIEKAVRLLDLMDSYEFAKTMKWNAYSFYHKDATNINFGQLSREYYKDSEGNIYEYNTMNKWSNPEIYLDPSNPNYVNSDWQRAMMRQVHSQDYRVNVTGGDNKGRFAVMGGFYTQPGILVNSDFQRASIRANYTRELSKSGAQFGMNLSGLISEQNGLATDGSGVTLNMLVQAPTKLLSAEDWSSEGSENILENNNPLYQAKSIKRQTDRTNINLRLFFELPVSKSLQFNIAGNLINNQQQNQTYYPQDVPQGRTQGGRAINSMTNSFNWNSENLLTFKPKFSNDDHRFDAMGGIIIEETKRKQLYTESHGFELEDLNTGSMQDGKILYDNSTTYTTVRMLSYLGRVNYSYKHYYFTGTIRFDGSSKFGPDNKWGVFPSGAVMWRLSNEPFLKNVKAVSNLKLRFSVGATGNSSIPSLQSLNTMSRLFYPTDGSSPSYGVITNRPANPYLKWESSLQSDVAVEFGFFKNRLSGTVEFYNKKTDDLLFEQPVLYATGYSSRWSNIASIRNRGVEFTLSGAPVRSKNISWTLDYNMSFNRSKVLSLGGASELILDPSSASRCTNFGILRVNEPLGNWYGYQSNGVWKLQSEIDALPDHYSSSGLSKSNLRPGATRLVDQNNDGTVNEEDRVVLGNSQPDFTGGLTNTLRVHNLTFTVGLEFTSGGKIFNATARELTQLNSGSGRNTLSSASAYWTPTLYDMTTGEIVHKGNEGSDIKMPLNGWESFVTDKYLEDASYLRIDNISLSYQLPASLIKSLYMNKVSIFGSVRNAYVFTNYTGYDPDVCVGSGIYADLLPKLDAASFPHSRTFTLGVNIVF